MMNVMNQKNKRIRVNMSDKVFDTILNIIVTMVLLAVLYPIIYVVSSSLSSGGAVSSGQVLLWPVEFSLKGYQIVFSTKTIWEGYANSIFFTVVGTLCNVIMAICGAYPMSRKNFQGKNILNVFFLISMFFGGNMITMYILVSDLGLVNNRWGYVILSGGVGIYNMILVRTYFQSSVPYELFEAARMDGISDFGYLGKILLPLSKPIISVITLYHMVGHWNAYMTPMIYLRDKKLQPLQLVLRQIMEASTIDATATTDIDVLIKSAASVDVMKYALIVVAAAPMLMLYPVVLKFFEKGIIVGSLKG